MKYGQYNGFKEFLQACTAAKHAAERQVRAADPSLEVARARARRKGRDVVKTQAAVVEYPGTEDGGGDSRRHVIINLSVAMRGRARRSDRSQARAPGSGTRVRFHPLRHRMGLEQPVPRIKRGLAPHPRGEWTHAARNCALRRSCAPFASAAIELIFFDF
ncbi:hypothetical protein GAY33_02510 [Azospirillum brasilense]|uniref:hypothetical protein n=1 Tax=Azospirillum argentinense TaxID=2970906 RepID=UPI00190CD769|nr:hypothetical protein [Azospirillum argentinense]MBK3798123.1 hypothetical protein [Azospirillum argentinense]